MTVEQFRDWLDRYFEAWVLNDPAAVDRGGPARASGRVRRRVLVVTFAPDSRCTEHREWFSHRETN